MPILPQSNSTELSSNIKKNMAVTFLTAIPQYTIDEVILPQEVKEKLEDIVAITEHRHLIYEEWGLGKVIKHAKHIYVNLYGSPGTGKTMAAHALINLLAKKMIVVNYAEIESKYVGETAKNLVALFKSAQEQDAILFFDEADALLSKRVTNMSSSTDVSVNQTRSVLLTLLDNYDGIIIFTTNFISNFDSAFIRRINYHIQIPLPDEPLRALLWKHYIPAEFPSDADCDELAQKYVNVTGNDIANAVLTAALRGARLQCERIPQSYFEDAITNIQQSTVHSRKGSDDAVQIEEREVSEEYVRQQLNH